MHAALVVLLVAQLDLDLPHALRAGRDFELDVRRDLPAGGSISRFAQRYRGLPVRGAFIVLRHDANGALLWTRSSAVEIDGLDTTPRQSANEAAELVHHRLRTRQLLASRLVVRDGRLAWELDFAFEAARQRAVRAWVDAHNGAPVGWDNRVRRASGWAFPENPIATPSESMVELTGVAAGSSLLAGPDLGARNCIDERTCDEWGTHLCVPQPTAQANGSGDFTAYRFASDTLDEDPFAEVQAFHHATVAYARARALGGADLRVAAGPLDVVVNYRSADPCEENVCSGTTYTGSAGLLPMGNAFYTPYGMSDSGGPAIVFGQGETRDFGYDGDVVYHELGHGVMHALNPDMEGMPSVDRDGLDVFWGSIHEGYADLFSLAVVDDPDLGEYAGSDASVAQWGENGAVRDLSVERRCPHDLVGQGHQDGRLLTAALLAARTVVARTEAERDAFDGAVFASQLGLPALTNIPAAGELVAQEIESSMGSAAAAEVRATLAARGLDVCRRIVDSELLKSELWLMGKYFDDGMTDPVPGAVQLSITLETSANTLALEIGEILDFDASWQQAACMGIEPLPVSLRAYLRAGPTPVVWTSTDTFMVTASAQADADVPIEIQLDDSGRALFTGPFAPGTYHVAIGNLGRTVLAYDLWLDDGRRARPEPPDWSDDGTTVTPPTGPGGPRRPRSSPEEGCNCANTVVGAWPFMALLLLLARRAKKAQSTGWGG